MCLPADLDIHRRRDVENTGGKSYIGIQNYNC